MKISADHFLDEILDIEAKGILKDLTNNINLFPDFIKFERADIDNSISYITKILKECYDSGSLRLAVYQLEKKLLVYALLFVDPQFKDNTYLQKIFVYEEYRNKGIGTQLLKGIVQSGEKVSLLCPENKISFYTENGFQCLGSFVLPDSDNFKLSKGFYANFYMMASEKEMKSFPLFLLNDNDLKYITSGAKKT